MVGGHPEPIRKLLSYDSPYHPTPSNMKVLVECTPEAPAARAAQQTPPACCYNLRDASYAVLQRSGISACLPAWLHVM